MFNYFVKQVLLPPVSLLLGLGLVLFFYERKRVPARRLGLVLVFLGLCLSTKFAAEGFARLAERVPPATLVQIEEFQGDCIVILGGGVNLQAPEFGGSASATRPTLERLNYGCYLARQTMLPVLVSGGFGDFSGESEAATMARTLKSWGLTEVLEEGTSRNTDENAKLSAKILDARGFKRVLLVTSASHMPRALRSFQKVGLEVLPAPTAFYGEGAWDQGLTAWLPTFRYFESSCDYLQALVGEVWYLLKD